MPTYEVTDSFRSDLASRSAEERTRFRSVVEKFAADLIQIEQGNRQRFRKTGVPQQISLLDDIRRGLRQKVPA